MDRWSLIASRLPGRTDNEIKNYWNTHVKRKLISRGIDPQTHQPLKSGTAAALTMTSAPTSTTRTASSVTHVDFRSSPPSQPVTEISIVSSNLNYSFKGIDSRLNVMAKCESVEDNNCTSSGTTTDEENQAELNLELSIGLVNNNHSNNHPTNKQAKALIFNAAGSKLQQIPGVCSCCQLGFQSSSSNGSCRNCQKEMGSSDFTGI